MVGKSTVVAAPLFPFQTFLLCSNKHNGRKKFLIDRSSRHRAYRGDGDYPLHTKYHWCIETSQTISSLDVQYGFQTYLILLTDKKFVSLQNRLVVA